IAEYRSRLDDLSLSDAVCEGTTKVTPRAPAVSPFVNRVSAKALGARTYTDTSYKVFTSPRTVRFKEQEYAIPREQLVPALRELRALFAKKDWKISFPIEVRLLPQEDAWLSMAYGRHSAFI